MANMCFEKKLSYDLVVGSNFRVAEYINPFPSTLLMNS